MTNYCVDGGQETDDPFAANFWTPRTNPATGAAVHEHRRGLAHRVGRRHEPQQHGRDALRRLHRRVDSCTSEVVRRAGRGVGAGDPERALDRGHVQEHQVLEQHPQLRRLLHVGAGHVPAEPRRGRSGAREHRRREVLLRGRRPDPEPDQGAARTRRSSRSGPARSRTSSTRRRATAPTSTGTTAASSRTASRRRRPLRQHDAVGRVGRRRDRRPRWRTGPASTAGDTIKIDAGHRERGGSHVASVAASNPPSPRPNVTLTAALTLAHAAGAVVAGGTLQRASASSRTTRPRASRRRSSSPPATTGSSSRRSRTRGTTRRPR